MVPRRGLEPLVFEFRITKPVPSPLSHLGITKQAKRDALSLRGLSFALFERSS